MRSNRKPEDSLTPREFEIVTLFAADGRRNADIARSLHIGYETVRTHVGRSMRKTGVDNRSALLLWYLRKYPTEAARERGYIDACLLMAERACGRRG